jgi:hypothetical protein
MTFYLMQLTTIFWGSKELDTKVISVDYSPVILLQMRAQVYKCAVWSLAFLKGHVYLPPCLCFCCVFLLKEWF